MSAEAGKPSDSIDATRWRELYHGLSQGFIYARVVRDEAGTIFDWRYIDVNRAWADLVGMKPEDARGRTVRELIPDIEDPWVLDFAQVVETHHPVHFTRQVGAFGRWYDGAAQWVGEDDFTVIFNEVTDRIEAQRKRDALLQLGDMLRDERDVDAMRIKAVRIIGETLGAQRTAYGDVEHARGTVTYPDSWQQDGLASLAGQYRFEDFGTYMLRFLDGETIVLDDVETDPSTHDDLTGWQSIDTRSAVNLPVSEDGRVVGILVVQFTQPRSWTHDEIAFLKSAGDRLETAIARRRAQIRQNVLNHEILHRMKNLLAMVQSVAMQTMRGKVPADLLDTFVQRLRTLGTAQDALLSGHGDACRLDEMIDGVLGNLSIGDRCDISGPEVMMGARAGLAASLLMHELATNAIKYGALSNENGQVTIAWRCVDDADRRELALDWIETGGPRPSEPEHRGFGSRLINMGLIGTGGSQLSFKDTGLHAEFRASLEQIEQA